MKRVPVTEQDLAVIQSRLPEHVMFLYGQAGKCSACVKALTLDEIRRAAEPFFGQSDNGSLIMLLVWCDECAANKIAQELAIDRLREAARLGPFIDDVWLTMAPDGSKYVVSEGQVVGEDGQLEGESVSLQPYCAADFPGGFGSVNILSWRPEYDSLLARESAPSLL